jgi:hypothetical protein
MVINNKGFMRVVEATVAVLIVLGVLLILGGRSQQNVEDNTREELSVLLEEISQNNSLRIQILSGASEEELEVELGDFVRQRIDSAFLNSSVEICEINEPCYLEPFPDTEGEVLAEERIIGATIREQNFAPKKLKVFVWRRF